MQSQLLLDESSQPNDRKQKLKNCLLILLSLLLFMLLVCIIMNFILTKNEKDHQDQNSICTIIDKNISYSQIQGLIKCDCKQPFYLNNSNSRCFKYLHLSIDGESTEYLQILVQGMNRSQFQLQDKYPFSYYQKTQQINSSQWKVELQTNPFGFIVTRPTNNQILFDTRQHEFIFTERLQQDPIGLGLQNTDSLYLQDGQYTLFPQNNGNKQYDLEKGQKQLSGHHPIYLVKDQQQWSVFYLKNYYPMSIIWNSKQKIMTFEIIGGNIDIRMFKKESQTQQQSKQNVVQLYHTFINKNNYRFPFWALSSWITGDLLNSSQQINHTINILSYNSIDIQNVLIDNQYLYDGIQFMVKPEFKAEDILEMRNRGIRQTIAIKYALKKGTQKAQQAENQQLLIRINNRTLVGCSVMNETVYLDHNNNQTIRFWHNALQQLNTRLQFEGIYLDDNQIYNTINYGLQENQTCNQVQKIIRSNQFPYWPGKLAPGTKGLNFSAVITNNGRYINTDRHLTEYDMHSINGYFQTLDTKNWWKQKMYFLVTETTIPETGGVAGHIIKNHLDISQQNGYLMIKRLLLEIVKLNLFGIQSIGIYLPTDSVDFKSLYNLGTLLPLRINYLQSQSLEQHKNTILYSNSIRHRFIKQLYSYLFKQSCYVSDQTSDDNHEMIWYEVTDLRILLQVDQQPRYINWHTNYIDQKGNLVSDNPNITLSDGLQLFQKPNSMVFYQSQNVSTIDQLDHKFNISIFLSTNQSSTINGTLLASYDYFDDSIYKCYQIDCLATLQSDISINSSLISIGLQNYMQIESEIFIQFIQIYYQVNKTSTNSVIHPIQQSLNSLRKLHTYKISL